MNKAKFIQRMTVPLILLGIFICSVPYINLVRAVLGFDLFITNNFWDLWLALIGGYMAALSGLIIWIRTIAIQTKKQTQQSLKHLRKPHLLGLSFLIPIPFLSCLLLIGFWQKDRHFSDNLDDTYRDTANFHVSLHLYLLMSFFLVPLFIGSIMILLIFGFYIAATIFNILRAPRINQINAYPINIKIALSDTEAAIELKNRAAKK